MRLRVLELPVPGLPPELDGLRIAHLSDFHLGVPSRGARAVERAVDWVAERQPDLVCITGDLLSRPRGERRCSRCSTGCRIRTSCSATTTSRSRATRSRGPSSSAGSSTGRCCSTRVVEVELRAARRARRRRPAHVARARRASDFAEPATPTCSILLCHFPRALDRVRAGPLPPDPRRPPARRPDRRCRTASAGCCSRIRGARYARRRLPARRDGDARLAGPRHDVRAVSLLRPPRGDRARSTMCQG